jgi:hypothetical protein
MHESLCRTALEALPPMFDSHARLFSHKALLSDNGDYRNHGTNPFYSAIALIGLLDQRIAPADARIPVGDALDGLHAAIDSATSPALLGTTVWACCLAGDRRGESLTTSLGAALESPNWSSMELALGLCGLVEAFKAYPALRDRCSRWARSAAEALLRRFSGSAQLFTGSRPGSPRNLTQPWLTSFATQAYPLHALAAYAREVSGVAPPALSQVARRLVEVQGPLGQWWWFYSSRSSAVLEGYPVYSVHQDAMAFMALMPLGDHSIPVPVEALRRGLEWELGANELRAELVRDDPPFLDRCIQRVGSNADGFGGISALNRLRLAMRAVAPVGRGKAAEAASEELEVLRESRPYHPGWLLYSGRLVASHG